MVPVMLTPTQIMTTIEALRMARQEILRAQVQITRIYPESVTYAEQLARYAELMADTCDHFEGVSL